jgi:tRNA(Ile)-lysidine synthase
MQSELETKVAEFVTAHALFESADRVLLAISGGADSLALMVVMCALKSRGIIDGELICAHVNHQLRGAAANADKDFVLAQAARLNLPVATRRVDVQGFARSQKLSIETAGRKLRIETLLDMARANNCSSIATGHQQNDNAETILHRLTRGTGFRGLAGIWPVRVFEGGIKFVRPLLSVTRQEIVEYLRQRSLTWREDRTNVDCRYRRNYIRHRLLPVLQQECAGPIVEQLSHLGESACKFYGAVRRQADTIWPQLANCADDQVVLNMKRFGPEPPAIKVELLRRSLTALSSGERDLTQRHYERMLQLAANSVDGKKMMLPGRLTVRREHGKLIFARPEKTPLDKERICESAHLRIPGTTRFCSYMIQANILRAERGDFERFQAKKDDLVEWFDLDTVKQPVRVRFQRDGDKFWPLGLPAKKRLGKFLTAAKVPRQSRENALIVADSEKIIWVWPVRISECAKVTSNTSQILQLHIYPVR